MKRTEADLWAAFHTQFNALNISAREFDAGNLGEACRLAAAAFVLVGRGQRHHKSILDQLNLQEGMLFPTTRPTPLIHMRFEAIDQSRWIGEVRWTGADALSNDRRLPFDEWWEETVLAQNSLALSRRQLVALLRDKDGGAHFDEEVTDPLMIAALKGQLSGFEVAPTHDGVLVPPRFSLENAMRQVAEELRVLLRFASQRYENTHA